MALFSSQFFSHWKKTIFSLLSDNRYLLLFFISAFFFIGSFILSQEISLRNEVQYSSTPVGDLFFDIIPKLDLSLIFIHVSILLLVWATVYMIFIEPEKIPFVLLAFSLFMIIRSACISFTHIGVPTDHIQPLTENSVFLFQNDLFFSAHTGAPFLGALIVWKKKYIRITLLLISVLMAFTVLAMRLHYSIDIIGAYFISYGIFHLAEHIYPNKK
jgi:hypothetical protein